MKLLWTQHIKDDPKKKEAFEQLLKNSSQVLGRLRDILQGLERSVEGQEYSLEDFDQPNWEHKQAFRNGQKATLKALQDLLDFSKPTIIRPDKE